MGKYEGLTFGIPREAIVFPPTIDFTRWSVWLDDLNYDIPKIDKCGECRQILHRQDTGLGHIAYFHEAMKIECELNTDWFLLFCAIKESSKMVDMGKLLGNPYAIPTWEVTPMVGALVQSVYTGERRIVDAQTFKSWFSGTLEGVPRLLMDHDLGMGLTNRPHLLIPDDFKDFDTPSQLG